jgi:hypothetical protein
MTDAADSPGAASERSEPARPPAKPGEPGRDRPRQFSIATLLLVMTLIGAWLAIGRISPSAAALLLPLVGLAFGRTMMLAAREKHFGGRLTAAEKVAVFLGSVAVVLVGTIVSCGACIAVFFVGFVFVAAARPLGEAAVLSVGLLSFAASLIAAIGTAWLMFRVTWPKRDEFVRQLHRGDLLHIPEKQHAERGKDRC